MSYFSEIKEVLNKIKYVFTEEYKEECELIEFKKNMRDKFKLKCCSNESVDQKIDRLRLLGYKSNFHIESEQLIFEDESLNSTKELVLSRNNRF